FGNRLVEVLLLLFGFRFGVQRFGRLTAPDQRFRRRIIHIERNLADVNGFAGGCAGAHAWAAPAAPSCAVAPPPHVRAERVETFFLAEGGLVCDVETGIFL